MLIIESPDALISAEERAAAALNAEIAPNPLSWLPPDLPSHVKASDEHVVQRGMNSCPAGVRLRVCATQYSVHCYFMKHALIALSIVLRLP